jgi:hypothetical protein
MQTPLLWNLKIQIKKLIVSGGYPAMYQAEK